MNSSSEPPWRAVIDIGTNSVLLLLARRHGPDAALEVASDTCTITRLGAGVATSGRLDPAAIARTLACLQTYRQRADAASATIVAVTTEGVRMASNRDDFLGPAAQVLGVPVRLLSGPEEAALSFRSVACDTTETTTLRVLDIGGGSTELAVGDREQLHGAVSHPVGAVRLTDTLAPADPPTPAMLAAVRAAVLASLQQHQPLTPAPLLHGVAGTVTTTAALLLGLTAYDRLRVDGSRFAVSEVAALRDTLARETAAERTRRPCLERGRADVIVTGLTILLAALEHCGATTLVVRDRGLRYSLI